jgi:hypothetical protein
MVEKVTREERMATLMKEAAEKAIEILGNKDDFMDEDLTGEEVKAKKPKAEKVADAKGSDSQKAHIRDAIGSDVKKANPYTLEGAESQSLRQQHKEHAAKKVQEPNPKYKCDSCPKTATQECTVCAARFCDVCKDHWPGFHPTINI